VPKKFQGRKITIKAIFDLGPFNTGGKPLEGKPEVIQL
jgi:hypothetical protein